MKNQIQKLVIGVHVAFLLLSCSAPRNVEYMQDLYDYSTVKHAKQEMITLQPLDQISVIVSCRDPQIAAMFNKPYYSHNLGTTQTLTLNNNVSASASQNISGYTVDSKGNIDFPILGLIHVAGMKREEVAEDLRLRLVASNQIKDPIVTVEYMNLGVSVIGEVNRPGRYKIDRDRFTIFDAISLAGDMTINGERTNVRVIRNNGNMDNVYQLDFTNGDMVYNSPAFYVHQGDVIYVSPNDKRKRDSTVNGNAVRSTSFWVSLSSLLVSIAVLVKSFI